MVKKYFYTIATLLLMCFAGCTDECLEEAEFSGTDSHIRLSMPEMSEVQLYSTALSSENKIIRGIILVWHTATPATSAPDYADLFDDTGIVGNGTAAPILPQLKNGFKLQTGDRVYIMINGVVTTLPTGLNENNINEKCSRVINTTPSPTSASVLYGKIDSWSPSNNICVMTRSMAKVTVRLGETVTDATGNFRADNVIYRICNYAFYQNIMPVTPLRGKRVPLNIGVSWVKGIETEINNNTVYIGEFPNSDSTIVPGEYVAPAVFSRNRTFVLLEKLNTPTDTVYYRLDFYDNTTKKYLDIERNHHYVFTINKVRSEGYKNRHNAWANPGSNIEYTITSVDDAASITSNGQYALSLTADTVTVYGANGQTLDALYANYVMPIGADYTWFTGSSNSISLVGSPADVTLLTTTVADTKSPVQMQFTGGATSVSLAFNVGNINRTVVVNYIPLGVWYRIDSSSDDDWIWWGTGTTLPASAAAASFDLKTDKGFTFSAAQIAAVNAYIKTSTPAITVDMDRAEYETNAIPNDAFNGNTKIKTFALPKNVNEIGDQSFYKCGNMTALSSTKIINKLGVNAFLQCKKLLTIPDVSGITEIPIGCFEDCNVMTYPGCITANVTTIGNRAFLRCHGMTVANLSSTSVTTLGTETFRLCNGLTSLPQFPNVEEYPEHCFRQCPNMTTVVIPEGCKKLWGYTISGLTNMTSLDIPASMEFMEVTSVGACANLGEIISRAVTAPTFPIDGGGYSPFQQNSIKSGQNVVGTKYIYIPVGSTGYTAITDNWYAEMISQHGWTYSIGIP